MTELQELEAALNDKSIFIIKSDYGWDLVNEYVAQHKLNRTDSWLFVHFFDFEKAMAAVNFYNVIIDIQLKKEIEYIKTAYLAWNEMSGELGLYATNHDSIMKLYEISERTLGFNTLLTNSLFNFI